MIRLFELRSERAMSQREMAKVFNISQGTYNNWENANTQPSIEQLIALAEYFDVTVDYLIGKSSDYASPLKDAAPRLRTDKVSFLKLYNEASEDTKTAIVVLLNNLYKKNN